MSELRTLVEEARCFLSERIVVPPRRGERGRKVAVRRLKRTLTTGLEVLEKATEELEDRDEPSGEFAAVLRELPFRWTDIVKMADEWGSALFVPLKAIDEVIRDPSDEASYAALAQSLKETVGPWSPLKSGMEAAERYLAAAGDGQIDQLVDRMVGWYDPAYDEGIRPEEVERFKRMATATLELKAAVETALQRFEAETAARSWDRPVVGAGETETLYHASTKARTLSKIGFEKQIPEMGGLGGSQQAGKTKGTSFTYDLYVAKEISRAFKELALIAKGRLKAPAILDWIKRERLAPSAVLMNMRTWGQIGGRQWDDLEIDHDGRDYVFTLGGKPVAPGKVFDQPWKVAQLYRSYLRSQPRRYDPYIMATQIRHLMRSLKTTNIRDIGVVVATVDMTHPDIEHVGGERELRVPPSAILSVDRVILPRN